MSEEQFLEAFREACRRFSFSAQFNGWGYVFRAEANGINLDPVTATAAILQPCLWELDPRRFDAYFAHQRAADVWIPSVLALELSWIADGNPPNNQGLSQALLSIIQEAKNSA